MLNRVILIGRLTRDPELKYTPSGVACVSNMSIAVDRPFGKKNEDGKKEVDFIDIVLWQQSAEFAANNLNKGRLIAIDGRLQIRNWTDKEGTKRRSAEVVANDVRALDWPKDKPGDAEAPADPDYFAQIGAE